MERSQPNLRPQVSEDVNPGGVSAEAFGSHFTVGLEEEVLLVDPTTYQLVHDAEQVLPTIEAIAGTISHEAYASELELRSPPSCNAAAAAQALVNTRAKAALAGATLMAAGVHPTGAFGDVQLVGGERYQMVERMMRGLMWRTPECALHVHIGVPDRTAALRVFAALRERLPLFEGLAANSPWWFGRDAGMASARASVVGARPGVGIPPALKSWEEYLETLAAIETGGGPAEYKLVWWHLRPHPLLGTVEFREMDVQSRLADTAGIGTLMQCLAMRAAEEPAIAPSPSAAIEWSSFRAARDGLDAEILAEGRLRPLRQVVRAALVDARPFARELGVEEPLQQIERILREGGGADRRRAAFQRGGLEEMLRDLVHETRSG